MPNLNRSILNLSGVKLFCTYTKLPANSGDPDQTQLSVASDLGLHCLKNDHKMPMIHTCHKLWTKTCEIRQKFKGDMTKFCEIFLNITLKLPHYSLKSFFM